VWIRRGNCSTADIEAILRARRDERLAYAQDEPGAFVLLG
jgi:predicted nuclease of predicted toxin-antitoxin system